ncbi:hypothetical protein [Pseudomonas aeruginosa]|uniref:hypothetical protein n=2 Tax=Pseudomonas aeruginosa TaxID=287 RepID=UPI0015E7B38C|nr:hypothetical protein [Pseudomonas aeruginosa]
MLRSLKVWWYLRKARQAYVRWIRANDDLDCGSHMAAVIRPMVQQHIENQAQLFDIYMNKLRDLGEQVPSGRLSKEVGHEEVKRYYSFFTSHPGDWRPCSKEHHDMVRANPQDWPGYEVRELAVIPAGHVVVSEGLLRRLLDSDGIDGIFDAQQNYAAHQELRALLSEQEGGKQ